MLIMLIQGSHYVARGFLGILEVV